MVSLTLSIPKELKKEMDLFPEINWSEVARQAIKERIELLLKMNKILSRSKLTERDTIMLGRRVNKELYKRITNG